MLENLGWRIVRIWSTDWVRDPGRQLERVISAYHEQQNRVQKDALPPRPTGSSTGTSKLEPMTTGKPKPMFGSEQTWYQRIEEVPESRIQELLVEIIQQCGSTPRDELIKETSQRLGFQRVGNRIKDAVNQQIDALVRKGNLNCHDDHLSLGKK